MFIIAKNNPIGRFYSNEKLGANNTDTYFRACLNVKEKVAGFHDDMENKYVHDNWVIAFVGRETVKKAKTLQDGKLIVIKKFAMRNLYDKEQKKNFVELRITEFEEVTNEVLGTIPNTPHSL